MSNVQIAGGEHPRLDTTTLNGMFAFRHQIFRERLGWSVESRESMERDDYDDLDPVYMVATDSWKRVEGCWRLLPTTSPYMLKDTFPQLLRGEKAPEDPHIWELSRFAVAPCDSQGHEQAALSPLTFEMIRQVYDFAVENDIHHYVTVTSVALERLLRKTGLPIIRFGDRKAQRVGKVLSVACWVPIDAQFQSVVYPEHTHHQPLKVAA